MKLNNILIKPIVTEKSMEGVNHNKYAFKASVKASKGAIAQKVASMFGVKVLNVKTSVMPGKKRRVLGTRGFTRTSSWKKAVVEIKAGQKIELFPKE